MANTIDKKWSHLSATLFSDLSEGIFAFGEDLSIIAWNPALVELLQLPPAVMTGATAHDLMSYCALRGDFGPGAPATLADAALGHLRAAHTSFMAWPVAGRTALRIRAKQVGEGVTIAFVAEEDVSGAPRPVPARARVHAGDSRLETFILGQIREGFVVTDVDGIIVNCNPAACEILGVPETELLGLSTFSFLPAGPEKAVVQDTIHSTLNENRTWSDETEIVRPDGSRRVIESSVTPMRGPDGAIIGRIGVMRDVTARWEAEKGVREAETKFRNLVDGSLQGVMIHRDSRIVYVNQSAAQIYGSTTDRMIGRSVLDYCSAEDLKRGQDSMRKTISPAWKLRGRREDGSTVWVEVNAREVDWEGEAARQVTIVDITEKQRAEEALHHAQKLDSLGQLTGGIAHDFNNLLGVISGNLELLREQIDNRGEHASYIEASLRSVRRGAELSKRLLAFARKQPLKPELTDLNELVGSMTTILQRTLGETINVEPRLVNAPWPVLIDPGQMENVLLNLALNARDAMPQGGRLLLETANLSLEHDLVRDPTVIPAGDYLKLTVRDTGTGMAPEVLEKAFEPFFTTKDVGVGSGLGLSMIYGFVQQSAGHIYIDSATGAGTTVHLYLPKAAQSVPSPSRQKVKSSMPAGNNEVVLVVEDDSDLRDLAVLLLNRMGYKTHEAADGQMAIALLDKLPHIDLLFTDLVLPEGIGGVEIAQAARKRFPGLKVLFTSGYGESASFQNVLPPDTTVEMISKPYRREVLAKRLQEVLSS
ncbi:PAS domain S-box protein [Iodidimonas sp. SYSU 1G8]|uniref:PAS domain S-box protein n=1 Tax=Iodidimonas sp. SYSU 1G8 TaxID=3133967 RepID=UPI0031FF09D5